MRNFCKLVFLNFTLNFSTFEQKNKTMETLLVKPKNIEELQFVQSVLNRMKIKSEVFEINEKKRRKKVFLDSFDNRIKQVNQDLKGEIKLQTLDGFLDEIRNYHD